jgi:hypothetical protein
LALQLGASAKNDTKSLADVMKQVHGELQYAKILPEFHPPKDAIKVSYRQLYRSPDEYVGKNVIIDGRVIQSIEQEDQLGKMVTLLIQSEEEPYGNNNIILVTHRRNDSANLGLSNNDKTRILEGDRVTLSGESLALRTYESALGVLRTVPQIYAYQIVIVPPKPSATLRKPKPPGEVQTPYDKLNRDNNIEKK